MLLTTILVIVLAFYFKEWYLRKKYGVSPEETTKLKKGETEFDKKVTKLFSKLNRKKKKDDVYIESKDTTKLLQNLQASGKAHLTEEVRVNELKNRLLNKNNLN